MADALARWRAFAAASRELRPDRVVLGDGDAAVYALCPVLGRHVTSLEVLAVADRSVVGGFIVDTVADMPWLKRLSIRVGVAIPRGLADALPSGLEELAVESTVGAFADDAPARWRRARTRDGPVERTVERMRGDIDALLDAAPRLRRLSLRGTPARGSRAVSRLDRLEALDLVGTAFSADEVARLLPALPKLRALELDPSIDAATHALVDPYALRAAHRERAAASAATEIARCQADNRQRLLARAAVDGAQRAREAREAREATREAARARDRALARARPADPRMLSGQAAERRAPLQWVAREIDRPVDIPVAPIPAFRETVVPAARLARVVGEWKPHAYTPDDTLVIPSRPLDEPIPAAALAAQVARFAKIREDTRFVTYKEPPTPFSAWPEDQRLDVWNVGPVRMRTVKEFEEEREATHRRLGEEFITHPGRTPTPFAAWPENAASLGPGVLANGAVSPVDRLTDEDARSIDRADDATLVTIQPVADMVRVEAAQPSEPIEPIESTEPTGSVPTEPTNPTEPTEPTEPSEPALPAGPTELDALETLTEVVSDSESNSAIDAATAATDATDEADEADAATSAPAGAGNLPVDTTDAVGAADPASQVANCVVM